MDRLPRRPELSLGRRSEGPGPGRVADERDDHATPRPVEHRREDASVEPDQPVRRRVQLRRHRRGRAGSAGERPGGRPDDLRNAEMGERRKEPQHNAAPRRRLHQLRARNRLAVLREVRGVSVRTLLLGLERAEPHSVSRAAVQRPGQVGRSGELREARRGGVHGNQGRKPAGAGLGRRDLGARKRQADGLCVPTTLRASSPSSSQRRTRA